MSDVTLQRGKAFFTLIGKARITDLTYKIDEVSASGYTYSRFNLGVETAPANIIYCESMGGFHPITGTTIYASSKDDFKDIIEIDWDDRNDETILANINDFKFIKVGLETYEKDGVVKTITRKFLSWYDAIPYIQQHLCSDTVVNVNGNLKYSIYNDKVQVKKEITSIYLSKVTKEEFFKATFVQSILIDKQSLTKDKENNEYALTARVIDYLNKLGKRVVKQNVPYVVNYIIQDADAEKTTKMLSKYFKVKKGITEITVEGNIIEGNTMKAVTENDIDDEMKELIEIGLYDKEEIIGKLAVRGERVSQMIITRPYILKTLKDDGSAHIQVFITPEKYKDEDLYFDFDNTEEETEEEPAIDVKETKADSKKESVKSNDDSWLTDL